MPTSVRLDAQTENLIQRLAKQRSMTKSEIIRKALAEFAQQEKTKPLRSYEAAKHLIGCVDSGGLELSKKTGEQFRNMIKSKAREKRTD